MARSEAGIELLVQGLERVELVRLEQTEPHLRARVRPLPLPDDQGPEVEALRRAVLGLTARALELAHPESAVNIEQFASQTQDPLLLVYQIGSMMSLDVAKEQALIEAPTRAEALRRLHGYLTDELHVLELRQGAVEPEATFSALRQRRVQTLLEEPELVRSGYRCTACTRLRLIGGTCVECGGPRHTP